jgi:hypothetical protein
LLYTKEELPVGPYFSLRDVYVFAVLKEMNYRKTTEKLSFMFSIREAASMAGGGKSSDAALQKYIHAIAPYLEEVEKKKQEAIFKLLEEESKRPVKIRPFATPTRKLRTRTK